MKKKELRPTPVDKNFFKSTKNEKKQFIEDVFNFINDRETQKKFAEANSKRDILISKQLAEHLQTIRNRQKIIIFATPYTTNITLDLTKNEPRKKTRK
jgi:ABC-type lipoprotein release transport system permease subunit